MKTKYYFLLMLFLLLNSSINAQQGIQIIQLPKGSQQNEPSIWIDPMNPDHIVAGCNTNYQFRSIDGGFNWEKSLLHSSEHGVMGDPCIITDDQGAFYYFHLSNPPAGSWIDRIVCQRLDHMDGEFEDGSSIGYKPGKQQDKEWAIFDKKSKNIYITWTEFDRYGSPNAADKSRIRFSKSSDRGESWSDAKTISAFEGDCIDDDFTAEGAVPTVDSDGNIYVCWAFDQKIWLNKSSDQGETWLEEEAFVCDQNGGWVYDIPGINRCNGLPITVCDLSDGPNKGSIYVNYSDQTAGPDDVDIWLVKSTDQGQTWTAPFRVNQDEAGHHQFLSWMCIDQTTGYLYFVYYDRRNHEGNATEVYLAISKDGGNTIQEVKLSEEAFIPFSSVFFGDYTNISAHAGKVRPIWIENHQGKSNELFTAIIDGEVGIQENFEPEARLQVYPNPIQESAFIKYKIRKPQYISIYIYNSLGQKVMMIQENEFETTGKYVKHLNTNINPIPAGSYYFVIQSEEKLIARKKVVIAS